MNLKVFEVYSKNGVSVSEAQKLKYSLLELLELQSQEQEQTVFSYRKDEGLLGYVSIRVSSVVEGEFKVINI